MNMNSSVTVGRFILLMYRDLVRLYGLVYEGLRAGIAKLPALLLEQRRWTCKSK